MDKGVVSMSAPYEFDPERSFSIATFSSLRRSQLHHAPFQVGRSKAPPFLLMHGRFDPLIRYELCEEFSGA